MKRRIFSNNNKKSSKIWLNRHFNDPYVKYAHMYKLRSRACFKLNEIHKKYKIFSLGMKIIDLGSSPGSWSQYAINAVGKEGTIIACDVCKMQPIKNVIFLQGDILSIDIYYKIKNILGDKKIDILLSDVLCNVSGQSSVDIPKHLNVIKKIIDMYCILLKQGGIAIIKIFQGEGFNDCLQYISIFFDKIKIFKPYASRKRSREIYFIAIGYIYCKNLYSK